MDDTDLNCPSLPLEWNGSVNPGQLNEVTMQNRLDFTECRKQGMVYSAFHRQSLDQTSPIRGRTMKEYDQQITELKNENFNLKLRIYFLEEKLQQTFTDSPDDLHKFNIDLKIEVENLKKELNNKHELLTKAYAALESMEAAHKTEINDINIKFEMQKSLLEEQIQVLQQKFNKTEIESDDTREELYQQAFASLSSKNSIEQKRIDERGIEDQLIKLSDALSISQNRIQELEKALAVKDAYIKEEEITSVKTQRFIQGIMKSIEEREKDLHQLQEKYELQASELKEVKEQLNIHLKEAETSSGQTESSHKSQKTVDDETVIASCLKVLGIVNLDVSNYSFSALINILKLHFIERQEKMNLILEEKSKLLKDNENKLMKYEEKLEETENGLKIASESIKKLNLELHKYKAEIDPLKSNNGFFRTSNDRQSEKYECQGDILGHIKNYIEFLSSDCHDKKEIERKSISIRQFLGQNFLNEQKLGDIEYIIRTNVAKMKLMDNQLLSVQERLSLLRNLIDRFQNPNGIEEKFEINNCLDLEDNMQAILQGIKVMSNLNNLFCQHITLNRELSSKKKQNISTGQLTINDLKSVDSSANDISDKLRNTISDQYNCETPLDTIIFLRNDYLKIIENLKEQMSSTEITIRMLDTKLKNYRHVLRSNINEVLLSSSFQNKSISDLLEFQMESVLSANSNLPLSAEYVLDYNLLKGKLEKTLLKNNGDMTKVNSMHALESLLECGRMSDVLELKEQMYRLKLLLEQVECQLTPNEVYSDHEMGRFMSSGMNPQSYPIHSNLREQTLHQTDLGSRIDGDKSWVEKMDNICQTCNGSLQDTMEVNPENIVELQWLRNVNNMMQMQLEVLINGIPKGRYSSLIQLQQQEISLLRNRCLESFDGCKLLRVRLEELVEFMERLLRFDENGLFDTSQFTPQTHELLKRQIAESRTLTRSISHSLLIDAGLSDVSGSIIGLDILEHFGKNNEAFEGSKDENQFNPKKCMDYTCLVSENLSTLLQNTDDISIRRPSLNNNSYVLSDSECKEMINLGTQNEEYISGNNDEYHMLDIYRDQIISAKYGLQRSIRENDSRDCKFVSHKTFHTLPHNDAAISDQGQIGCNKPEDLSPSDSESWSEPDRDVSQQRIGLKLENHELSPKFKLSCSLSNNESTSDNSSLAKNVQRLWSKSMEIENLQQRLQNEIEVNKCLRSELKLCNLLEKDDNDKHVNYKNINDDICNIRQPNEVKVILTDHLLEIQDLRFKLEELFKVNNELTGKLEKRLKTKQQYIHQTQDEVDRLAVELDDKECILSEVDQQIQYHLAICNKQNTCQVEKEELHEELANLTEKLHSKSIQVHQLEKEVVAREEGCLQLKEANYRLQNNYAHIQRAFTDKEGVIEELHNANVHLQKLIDKLHKEHTADLEKVQKEKLEAWTVREKELNDELKISREDCQRFTTQFNEFKLAIVRMEEQLEQEHGLRLSMKQKLNEVENVVLLCKETEKELKEELHEGMEKNSKLQGIVDEKEKLINELEDKLQKTNSEKLELIRNQMSILNGFEMNMSLLKNKSIEKLGGISNNVIGLEKKLTELKKVLKEKTESLLKKESCYEQSQMMIGERNTTIKKLEEELKKAMELNDKLHQLSLFTADNLKETKDLNSSLKNKLLLYEQLHLKGQIKNSSFDINHAKLITEMRCLQTQLELSIQTNNALREEFGNNAVKSDGSRTDTKQGSSSVVPIGSEKSFNEFSTPRLRSNLTIRKCASYPNDCINSTTTEINLLRQQSKSLSDYVCENSIPLVYYKTLEGKKMNRAIEPYMEQSISDELNSHNVYSSPDLGIESDPGLLSSLEKRISNITEEHLREIHECEKSSKGSPAEKLSKQNAKSANSGHLVYAIGYANDYDMLKKDLENNLLLSKGLQSRVKERLQCATRTSLKNSEYMSLKEIEKKLNNMTIGLGKSSKLLSSFWKSMLKPPALLEAKNAKLLDENLLLKKKLEQQKLKLQDALSKLASGSRLKEGMEKAIMKQLTKTHDILKRAKGNLEDQANNPKIKS